MPKNLFGNFSNNAEHKVDTSLFVQKPYSRTKYMEANIDEDLDLKNQFRFKNLRDPISIREAFRKYYVDKILNDPKELKKTRI